MEEKKKRVLEAAKEVFLKYGYVKTTMNDIALVAAMSRPALYLIYPSKEEIFNAVILYLADELSNRVRIETACIHNPLDKLKKTFDIWCIQMHERLRQSVEAKELYQCSYSFAKESMCKSTDLFEQDIASILSLLPATQLSGGVTPKELAHVFVATINTFKQNSESSEELCTKIELLIRVGINESLQ